MIIDKLENAHIYYGLGENLKEALQLIEKTDFSAVEDGRHTVKDDDIYFNLQTYTTKEEQPTPWEIHRKYIDIQFMIDGEECMGWSSLENFAQEGDFNIEKDIAFGTVNEGAAQFIKAPNKFFVIFTPEDAHKPALKTNEQKTVRKVIVKVKP